MSNSASTSYAIELSPAEILEFMNDDFFIPEPPILAATKSGQSANSVNAVNSLCTTGVSVISDNQEIIDHSFKNRKQITRPRSSLKRRPLAEYVSNSDSSPGILSPPVLIFNAKAEHLTKSVNDGKNATKSTSTDNEKIFDDSFEKQKQFINAALSIKQMPQADYVSDSDSSDKEATSSNKDWYNRKRTYGKKQKDIVYTQDTIHLYKNQIDFSWIRRKQMQEEYKTCIANLTLPTEIHSPEFKSGLHHIYFKIDEIYNMTPAEKKHSFSIRVLGMYEIEKGIRYIKDCKNDTKVEVDFSSCTDMPPLHPIKPTILYTYGYLDLKRRESKIIPLIRGICWTETSADIHEYFEHLLLLQRCVYGNVPARNETDSIKNEDITIVTFSDEDMSDSDSQLADLCAELSKCEL